MNQKVPLFKIYSDRKDIEEVAKVIRSGIYWAEGKSIEKFEVAIAKYADVKFCVVFNSGTSALHAALWAYGIKENDEVIVPSFTFIATANAVLFVGAKPVFSDIEEDSLCLDPQDVERKISPQTKAIIVMHYGGSLCKIEELKKIASRHNLILIEDAAESFGAKLGSRMAGTFGGSGMFSFCQNKIITTGEGGCIVTAEKKIYERLKLVRSHGRATDGYFSSVQPADYIELGYNFRMSSLAAALGLAQLKKIDKIIKMRRKNAQYLTKLLKQGVKGIKILNHDKSVFNVYQLYTIRVNQRRDELRDYLARKGIMAKVYFEPVHLTHFYKQGLGFKCSLPITEAVSKEVLSLPMYPSLKKNEIDYIVKEIRNFYSRRKNE